MRTADKLEQALSEINAIRATADRLDVRPSSEGYADLAHALDLRASLLCAEATVKGALARRETRGCHARADFPELDAELQVNFVASLDATSDDPPGDDVGRLTLTSKPVAPVPEELVSWIDETELEVAGRLLE